jgi:hypothetical protein
MKYWQLMSVMRANKQCKELINIVASAQVEWQFVAEWLAQDAILVNTQDRAKLDYELPDAFVRAALEKSDLKFYLSEDGWLRSWKMSPSDELMTAVNAFNRYGGEKLEDAYEKASVKI